MRPSCQGLVRSPWHGARLRGVRCWRRRGRDRVLRLALLWTPIEVKRKRRTGRWGRRRRERERRLRSFPFPCPRLSSGSQLGTLHRAMQRGSIRGGGGILLPYGKGERTAAASASRVHARRAGSGSAVLELNKSSYCSRGLHDHGNSPRTRPCSAAVMASLRELRCSRN
jgi:hypothetical protein